jgi:hypothetical protein
MPFTGSHPAAVLPLLRLGLPASALVIGSIAPDLPYYLPTPVTAVQTHTLAGVFGANLLLGLSAFLVWHLLLVPPLLWAAPEGLQRRIPTDLRRGLAGRLHSAADLARVCVAVVLGALTHVVWDAFTHSGMWGTRMLPWLSTSVGGLALYRWLHVVSSVIGLAGLAWFAVRWWRSAPAAGDCAPIPPGLRWGLAAGLFGWAAWAAARVGAGQLLAPGPVNVPYLPVDILIQFFSTLTVGMLGAAVVWHVAQEFLADRDPPPSGSGQVAHPQEQVAPGPLASSASADTGQPTAPPRASQATEP